MLIEYFFVLFHIVVKFPSTNEQYVNISYVCVCVHELYYSNKFENNANQFQPQIKQ